MMAQYGLLAAGLFTLIVLIWGVATYNRFAGLRQHISESWSDIDVELKRRYELIPNLVETVRGYVRHERETLERVVELRSRAMASRGSPASQAVDESALLIGLRQLFAVAEAYPSLKADAQFLALQKELANTEDRIAAARRFYNSNVREMSVLLATFPTRLIGRGFDFEAGNYFELDSQAERVVPRVDVPSAR